MHFSVPLTRQERGEDVAAFEDGEDAVKVALAADGDSASGLVRAVTAIAVTTSICLTMRSLPPVSGCLDLQDPRRNRQKLPTSSKK